MSHPWAQAWREFEDKTLPLLKEHGKRIGAAAQTGDELAKKIMGHYSLLERSFDPMTHTFLQNDLNAWLAQQEAR